MLRMADGPGVYRLVDSAQMSAIDREASERFRIPSPILMENAGLKALDAMQRRIWRRPVPEEPVTIVSGRGNNGGDALVIARQLHAIGARSMSVLLSHGEPAGGSQCAANLAICRALGITVLDAAEATLDRGWVIDGIAGTGQRGALRGPPAALAERINRGKARVIALDAPSGVGDRFTAGMPAVHADWTLALELPKRALYLPAARPACGTIIVVPIGFPAALTDPAAGNARLLGPAALAAMLPSVPADAHKGTRGHVAVLAGSAGTAGAARLAATAAACSRAGLVTLHADADTYPVQAGALTSVMVAPWSEAAAPDEFRRFDSLVVGPGWGTGPARSAWLQRLLALPYRGVLDADAITLLARAGGTARLAGRWVLTPPSGRAGPTARRHRRRGAGRSRRGRCRRGCPVRRGRRAERARDLHRRSGRRRRGGSWRRAASERRGRHASRGWRPAVREMCWPVSSARCLPAAGLAPTRQPAQGC